MRHIEFAPFYRSAIGFDRLFNMLDQATGFDNESTYPPYNIERTGENAYRITLAVAGFTSEELKLEVKEQTLTVSGEKAAETSEKTYLHRGIAARAFERRYPACRPRRRDRRQLREWTAACRSRSQCPGKQEAALDCDRHRRQRQAA